MTTKDKFLFLKDKQKPIINSKNDIQYSNLNLNQNHHLCPISIPLQSCSKSFTDKSFDSTVSDTWKSHTWNKNSKISKLSILNDETEEETGKRWRKVGSFRNSNNSTLAFHISAYENSVEPSASDSFDAGRNKNDNNESIEKQKLFNTSTFVIQNPFEFPRQQNNEVSEPEVCQFQASQRLFNGNLPMLQQVMTVTEEGIQENGRNSPTIFSTQISTISTEENLSFDPQMFTSSDFNIDTLMDNIRHQLDLKDIDKQLRQILQHFQYALINLINNDYTQFVELSSSLVALDKSVESLNKEHEASWEDYNTFAKKLSDLYSFFEKQQSIINESRTREALNVCELNIYLILDEVVQAARKKQHSWLKYSFSRLNVLNVYLNELEGKNAEMFEQVKDEIKPSLDFVKRAISPYISFNPEDLASNYYMLLNIRELDMIEEGINIASKNIISYSRIDGTVNQKWKHFLDALSTEKQSIVESIHSTNTLSSTAKLTLQKFYLSALLASMVSFTQENFEYDFIPSDSEPFQESYLAFHEFYQSFPEYQIYASYFKKILSYFDVSVYIQLWVKDSYRSFIDSAIVDNVKLLRDGSTVRFNVSENFSSNIQALCSVKTLPGSSSCICQTFYNCLEKYYDFCEDMRDAFGLWNSDQYGQQEVEAENQQWEIMLVLQISMKKVVAEALEMLEKKMYSNRDSNDATYANFVKYRNAILLQFQALEVQIESFLHTKLFKDFVKHVSMVGNVPKKYRWTKMPFPKEHSDYVISVRSMWESFIKIYGENKSDECKSVLAKSLASALDTFIAKATEVLDTVDKTANVLRQKGKSLSSDANDSDESKMKQQIILDTESFISLIGLISEANETVEKLKNLLERAQSN